MLIDTTTPRPKSPVRPEPLPAGWHWLSHDMVRNEQGEIVFLTSGLRHEKDIARAISATVMRHEETGLRKRLEAANSVTGP